MASDALGADEAREKHRWGENRKVYTRKTRRPSKNDNTIAAATDQHTATAVVTTATANDHESEFPQAKEATEDNGVTVTTAAEGGDTAAPPLNSESSPAMDANSQPQQLTPPRTEEVCDDLSIMNRQEDEIPNVPPLHSQSDANSPQTEVVCEDSSSLSRHDEEIVNVALPDSQSSPAKDTNSQPHQLNSPRAEDDKLNRQEAELQNAPLPNSQSSPANVSITEMDSPRAEAVCDDTSNLNRQEGELQNITLPNSESSPVKDVNSQSGKLEVVHDDTLSLTRQEEEFLNVTLPNSQSSPIKNVDVQPQPQNSPITKVACDDTSILNRQEDELTLPISQSSPVKDVDSQPEQLDLPSTEMVCDDTQSLNRKERELLNATLTVSQSLPVKDVDSQSQQLNLPSTEMVCDDTQSLNRQEGESLNATLTVSQSLPVKDVDSQPAQLNLPTTEMVCDDKRSLNRQEGDLLNATLPISESSPVKDVDSQPQQLNLPSSEMVCDDTQSLNRQEGEHLNATLTVSESLPVKDVNSQPVQLNLATDEMVCDDTPSLITLPISESLPVKDVNSQPVQLNLPTTEEVHDDMPSFNRQEGEKELPNVTLPISESVQLNLPIIDVACDNNSSLNRQEDEVLNTTLPNSQSSPIKDVDSQTVQLNLPTTEMVCDDTPSLIRQEEELPNVALPNSQSSPIKNVNSQQKQLDWPTTEVGGDDTLSLNRQEVELPNGDDVASVVTRVGDKVNIRLSSATPKQEARALKRKLASDLDQVRSLAKRLDMKESQLFNGGLTTTTTTSAETGNNGVITGHAGQSLSQYSTSAAMGLNDSRPYGRLSVSVMDINRRGGSEIVEKRTPKANQFYQSSDFISGKERLPIESNKKQKSSGGRKKQSGGGGGGSDFDKQIFKKCGTLLQQLMKHKFGWVFNTPVDVKGLCLHDYYDVIKHPMDLGTVKNRLSKNWYKSPMEFAEDIRLTFTNAMTYNPEGQDVHVMALEMANIFEQKWVEIQAEYSRKLRYEGVYDMGLPTPTSRLTPFPSYGSPPTTMPSVPRPVPVYSAPVGRVAAPKKPKAKDVNKRDMTYEEKQKLSTHLQDLPSEKLDSIVQIIKKRNPSLCQQDEEIEVDIDSVDAETLWELDRFVINYKKTLSKHKRKAELALQKAQAQQSIQSDRDTMGGKAPNKTTPVNVPSPAREGKQTDNASNSSSSSSSSSDSGSSSSDSDSDSSSASGSDRG